MKKYLAKRLLISVIVFFGITFLVYLLSNLTPGSPVDQYITPETRPEDIERIRAYLGLNQPMIVRYVKWLWRMIQGDLGHSFRTSSPALTLIAERVGPTLLLAASSLVLSLLIAIPLGVLSAYKPYTVWDYVASGLSYLGAAVPNFFIGLIGIYIFSVKLGLLPTGSMYTSGGAKTFADLAWHMTLPVLVISVGNVGIFLRQTRSSMLESLNEEYVRMARAKGLRERKVIFGHVLRNASIPIVTSISLMIPYLISGTVVVEQIFTLPGLGNLLMQSIMARDYPVIMAVTVFIALVVLGVNIAQDIIYGCLDPRIRYE
jgi:peptide/nickel transport system permease protein